MTTQTANQSVNAIRLAITLIEDAARDAGTMGEPSGYIYAAMAAHGRTLNAYTAILRTMQDAGRIVVEHDCVCIAR